MSNNSWIRRRQCASTLGNGGVFRYCFKNTYNSVCNFVFWWRVFILQIYGLLLLIKFYIWPRLHLISCKVICLHCFDHAKKMEHLVGRLHAEYTVKILNIRTPKKFAVCTICTRWLYRREMHPKDAAGIANNVDPDQTALLGAIWSGSALFAQA